MQEYDAHKTKRHAPRLYLRRERALGISCIACVFLFSILLSAHPATAQDRIVRDVVGGGGGKTASVDFQLSHTVGQPSIGLVQSDDHSQGIGFWYGPWFFATGVKGEDPVPLAFRLEQNYPNPFNPATTIKFSLPKPARVVLKIYDVGGREIMTVVDRRMDAGIHKVPVNARGLASGVYFYRLRAADFVKTKKLVVLR
jgi:hypothetical protein